MTMSPWLRRLSAATVLLLAAPVAWAADAEHGGSEPSLFAGDLGNALWTLIIFALLLFVLGRFAWGPILRALQKREEFIRDSLDGAKKDREDAEVKLNEVEQRLQGAQAQASGIIDEGRKSAEAIKRQIEQDARREAEAMISRAKQEIGLARDSAVKELYDLTAALATEAASKIISKEIDPASHERLIAESIEELSRRSGNGHK
jgi:F-type H+-transporting ATPase subunit b